MTNECVICLTNIDNETNTNIKYHFQQECTCFYNVHNKCLIEWTDKHKTCIHCYKQLSYNIISTFNHTEPINETNLYDIGNFYSIYPTFTKTEVNRYKLYRKVPENFMMNSGTYSKKLNVKNLLARVKLLNFP